jgi:hypothetical protein
MTVTALTMGDQLSRTVSGPAGRGLSLLLMLPKLPQFQTVLATPRFRI